MTSTKKPSGRRIGIDITSAVSQGAGIGRYTRELVTALLEADTITSYSLFYAKRPSALPVPNPIPRAANATYHEAPLSERWLHRLWYRLNVPLTVQRFTGTVDLFHSPDFVLPPVGNNIPTLLTVHDLSYLHFPETFTPALVAYLNKLVPTSVDRATHVLADSKATKRDLIAYYSVPADKVTVLYSGVSALFVPERSEKRLRAVREKYALGQQPYVLSVSTLQPRKNYQLLIRAFKAVAEQRAHNLVIAGGKGWLHEEITAEITRQDLEDRVLLIGFVDDIDLPALYSGASLFAYPSLYEGFGLPLLEAMACGVPVLNSNASSLPEVVGEATLQLEPHEEQAWSETMLSLLDDSTKRASMVAAGFMQARQFTWDRAAQELKAIYTRLLDGPVM